MSPRNKSDITQLEENYREIGTTLLSELKKAGSDPEKINIAKNAANRADGLCKQLAEGLLSSKLSSDDKDRLNKIINGDIVSKTLAKSANKSEKGEKSDITQLEENYREIGTTLLSELKKAGSDPEKINTAKNAARVASELCKNYAKGLFSNKLSSDDKDKLHKIINGDIVSTTLAESSNPKMQRSLSSECVAKHKTNSLELPKQVEKPIAKGTGLTNT